MKDEYGIISWVREDPNASDPRCQVLEVKKFPEEISDDQIKLRKEELKKIYGPFRKVR